MFIDTHAHLNHPELRKDIAAVLERANNSGIEYIIVPATNYQSSLEVIELAENHDMVFAAVGIHPTEIKNSDENHLTEIEKLCKHEKVVAVGEIGLDYYWKPYDKGMESRVLREQLKIAKRAGLPVILHNRESSEDLMAIVSEEYEGGKLRCQFHSFSGDIEMAGRCFELGFYISFTGNITFKPNERTLTAYEIVKRCPPEHLLLETDSPYLAPIPYRGKRNEPSYLRLTAKKISELKGISVEDLGRITSENVKKLFGLPRH
jgi:TatD DNase family protein